MSGFRGPECLDCGGIRSVVKESGYSADDQRIRRRVCSDCGQDAVSVEVYIPEGMTTFWRLNPSRASRKRENDYQRRGKGAYRLLNRRSTPDRLSVQILVAAGGRPRATHCMRGHELTGENVYVNPGDGERTCVTCRRLRARNRSRAA